MQDAYTHTVSFFSTMFFLVGRELPTRQIHNEYILLMMSDPSFLSAQHLEHLDQELGHSWSLDKFILI